MRGLLKGLGKLNDAFSVGKDGYGGYDSYNDNKDEFPAFAIVMIVCSVLSILCTIGKCIVGDWDCGDIDGAAVGNRDDGGDDAERSRPSRDKSDAKEWCFQFVVVSFLCALVVLWAVFLDVVLPPEDDRDDGFPIWAIYLIFATLSILIPIVRRDAWCGECIVCYREEDEGATGEPSGASGPRGWLRRHRRRVGCCLLTNVLGAAVCAALLWSRGPPTSPASMDTYYYHTTTPWPTPSPTRSNSPSTPSPTLSPSTPQPTVAPSTSVVPTIGADYSAKLLSPNGRTGDAFGRRVAIHRDTLVVGAPKDKTSGQAGSGLAHVYIRSGESWEHQGDLAPPSGEDFEDYGSSVAIHGETTVVCYESRSSWPWTGFVDIYVRAGSAWTLNATLGAPDEMSSFCSNVAIDEETVAVGAEDDNRVYIYAKGDGDWAQHFTLEGGRSFGSSVALHGNTLVVGTPRGGARRNFFGKQGSLVTMTEGYASIYTRNGGTWEHQADLAAKSQRKSHFFWNECRHLWE